MSERIYDDGRLTVDTVARRGGAHYQVTTGAEFVTLSPEYALNLVIDLVNALRVRGQLRGVGEVLTGREYVATIAERTRVVAILREAALLSVNLAERALLTGLAETIARGEP